MRVIYLFALVASIACTKQDPLETSDIKDKSAWLIDTTRMTGTVVNDKFPVATNPSYTNTNSAVHVKDYERVVVFKIGGDVFIYPIELMGVEVINGKHNNTNFAVTYCPRTQTTYVVSTKINDHTLLLKASGLLYAENLVYYDMISESYWSQMLYKCIKGEYKNQSLGYLHSFETSYKSAKKHFPFAKVLANYDTSFKTSPVIKNKNTPEGNLVLGLVQNSSSKPGTISLVDYTGISESKGIIVSGDLLIAYDKSIPFITAFRGESFQNYTYTDDFPNIIQDAEGNAWNVFGQRVKGSGIIKPVTAYLASFWAWEGMFENPYFIEGQGGIPR